MLSFDKAPPFSAPLRFFLTAPLFAILAGVLLVIDGENVFASRWTPAALAATHLVTIGFMLQVMLGALIQILPVVAGATLAQPLTVARVTHIGLTLGVLALCAGLYYSFPLLLKVAVILLGVTIVFFLFAAARVLLSVPSSSPTVRGIKFSLLGLASVLGLGITLASALAYGWALPLMTLVDLHAGWGLGAWAGILLAAVAYVVVPMFQLTPGYPARVSWWFPVVLFFALLSWSLALWFQWSQGGRLAQAAVGSTGIVFAVLTLRLQKQRRRARADATYRYWQLALGASIFALTMLCTAAVWPELTERPLWTLLFGVLLLVGGFMSFIIGMLYKIVPFLAWMHLQSLGRNKVPAMNKLLPDADTQKQMWMHLVAVVLLIAAALFPVGFSQLAGLAVLAANAGLMRNLVRAVQRYREGLVAASGGGRAS